VPWRKFKRAVQQYIKSHHECGKCEGFEIQEWFGRQLRGKRCNREKVRLSYKGVYVYLWGTTWAYVVHQFQLHQIPQRKWKTLYKYFM
jgi:hypothetical protein